ncbi:hypothetical protein WCLP8_1550005 [uncultured Gammaproteobacteria bacterium]
MTNAFTPIGAGNVIDLRAGGRDAGQMRGGDQAGFALNSGHGGVSPFPGRPPGTIGNGHKRWCQRRKTQHGLPQALLHLFGFGRKELETDRRQRRIGFLAGIDHEVLTPVPEPPAGRDDETPVTEPKEYTRACHFGQPGNNYGDTAEPAKFPGHA